jgi:hypothetical protein
LAPTTARLRDFDEAEPPKGGGAVTAYMLTNRQIDKNEPGIDKGPLRFFRSDKSGSALSKLSAWTELNEDGFRKALASEANGFPRIPEEDNENQRHIGLFVHGYNNTWKESVERYEQIRNDIYLVGDAQQSMGVVVLFSWPSDGFPANYLPDREDARQSAPDLARMLVVLHDQIVVTQRRAAAETDAKRFCKAKISVIAHSMGAYVMQKALASASKTLSNPQLITLIHQLVLVAADVDNDLFEKSQPDDSDGSLEANLCYRIGALFTGLDPILGASAGLKHFGKRRLGRSGLADPTAVWDNVFDKDVTDMVSDQSNIHSGAFTSSTCQELIRLILRGRDRKLLATS